MVLVPYTLSAAIVPALLLIFYFYKRDANPEPMKVVWITFLLGIGSIIPVLLSVLAFRYWVFDAETLANPYVSGLAQAFYNAAIPEELFKFVALFFYAYRHREFDEPMDGIVYGAVASLGFAAFENVLYCMTGGMLVAIMRALTSVPGHAAMGAIMGYFVGQAKFSHGIRKVYLLASALIWPTLLHGLYDFPLLTIEPLEALGGPSGAQWLLPLITLSVLAIEILWTIRLVRRLRREQLVQFTVARPAPAQAHTLRPAFAPASATIPASTPASAWLMIIGGGLLVSVGGMVLLGVGLGSLINRPSADEILPLILGTILLGIAPLALGLIPFIFGLRRIPPRVRRRDIINAQIPLQKFTTI